MSRHKITVRLDWPPRELSPNARSHWARRQRWVRTYRGEAKVAALTAMGTQRFTLRPPVAAMVVFHPPDGRSRDQDNLLAMLKPAWDGFQDAGIIEDDSADKLRIGTPVVRSGPPAGVEIVLTEAQR